MKPFIKREEVRMIDISIPIGGGRFNFRDGVVLLHRERVLLHKQENDDYWALPGGRVAVFEQTKQTAIREMKEELGIAIGVDRPLWITENFFTYTNESFHEIAVNYQGSMRLENTLYKGDQAFVGQESDRALIYQWIPIERVQSVYLRPKFLQNVCNSCQPLLNF